MIKKQYFTFVGDVVIQKKYHVYEQYKNYISIVKYSQSQNHAADILLIKFLKLILLLLKYLVICLWI